MDPTGPSQPTLNTAYDQPSNPAQSSSERADSNTNAASLNRSMPASERREPNDAIDQGGNDKSEAMPSSLGYGARDASGDAGESMGGEASDLEGEQMRAPGEGDIAARQEQKHGFGEQSDLASGLDRKKAEQQQVKNARSSDVGEGGDVDVEGALGGGNKGFVSGGNEGPDSQSGNIQSTHADV